MLVIVADGAGGVGGGATAAETLCSALESCVKGTPWESWLAQRDREMSTSKTQGLAAAVVLQVANDGAILGASVGDCEAWILEDGQPRSLTSGQQRKPLLGSGAAIPVAFTGNLSRGTLVVGTDGLWKYTNLVRIREAAAARPHEAATQSLTDAVRLRSGSLQDDVAVFVLTTESP
jgi:serine/threonine protein phosphatase PrpC